MSQLTREERRKKILGNAESRLQKLKKLKERTNAEPLIAGVKLNDDSRPEVEREHLKATEDLSESANVPIDSASEVTPASTSSLPKCFDEKHENLTPEYLSKSPDEKLNGEEHNINKRKKEVADLIPDTGYIRSDVTPRKLLSADASSSSSFMANKYRFVLFVLLGWVVFLVVVRDFDSWLAHLIGRQLPKKDLPLLVWTSFLTVETQVVLLRMCVGRNAERTYGMVHVVLSLLRVPQYLVTLLVDLAHLTSGAITDFCVYIFTIVILTYFNDSNVIHQ